MSDIKIMNAEKVLIDYFYSPINSLVYTDDKESHHRYKSWEYCYEAFHEAHKTFICNKANFTEKEWESLALHLGFYLASWGMYRGSSFLLQKDYKIHIEPIKTLFKTDWIWGSQQDPDAFVDFNNKELISLRNAIAKDYGLIEKTINVDQNELEDEPKGLTDTLFTKILLGVCGNIPAYDRYCKKALIKLGWNSNPYSEESYINIKKNADNLENILDKWPKHSGKKYPKMKLMDMFCFEYGYFIECAENLGKVSTDIKKISYITRLQAILSFAELYNTDNLSIPDSFVEDIFNDSQYYKDHANNFNKNILNNFANKLCENCMKWLKDNPSVKVKKNNNTEKEIGQYYNNLLVNSESDIQKCHILLEIIVKSKKSIDARDTLLNGIENWHVEP